jgi:hypothetical protein
METISKQQKLILQLTLKIKIAQGNSTIMLLKQLTKKRALHRILSEKYLNVTLPGMNRIRRLSSRIRSELNSKVILLVLTSKQSKLLSIPPLK